MLAIASLLSLASGALYAAIPVNSVLSDSIYPIEPEFQIFRDIENKYTFESLDSIAADDWQIRTAKDANFGFQQSHFWLRTTLHNDRAQATNFIAALNYVQLDDVVFRATRSDGTIIELATGDQRPFYPRHIDHPGNMLSFQLAPQETIAIAIGVQTEGSMLLPLEIWEEKAFFESVSTEKKFHFFYYGIAFVIILINLAVFTSLRERLYLYYALAIAGYLVFFATSPGYLHQILLPDAQNLNSKLFVISMPFLALFSLLFARQFLRPANHSPRLDMALKAMIVFEYFNLAVSIFGGYDLTVRVSALGGVLLFSVLFAAGPISWYKGRRAGIYFTIAWTPLTIGVFAASGRLSGFLPDNFWTEYAMQIGSGIEAIVLTLALAERLYREREKKIKAQEDSLLIEKQRNMTQALLTESVSRDSVTQLSNRNRFEWLVRDTIKSNPDKSYFLTVAKISRLEDISRTLGLSTADHALRLAATRFSNELIQLDGLITHTNGEGRTECVYQLSRDTFGTFGEMEIYEETPEKFIESLDRLSHPVVIKGMTIDLSPVFGIALYPNHGKDPATLIRNAVIGMESSRGPTETMGLFHRSLDIYDENRLTLAAHLRKALNQDKLQLYYQPKIDVRTKEVVGMEGLARWIDPERGFIPPDTFIPLAEETGLINRLTLWAFERAVKDFEKFRQNGYTGSISVNISARDLLIENLHGLLAEILERHSVPADKIYLELTETGAMKDPEAGIATLNAIAELGLKISIDDFGAGYSSLSYLQRLPATEIKLDRSLIHDVCDNDSSAVIVKTSIDMVHALGYNLVAEGVEDEATVEKLTQYNCDCFQGYFYCKPMAVADAQGWLAENRVKTL
jgi:EAL domain-containing protein (putative c-di-GMP-specific phosphodiesterase class I)/GGDEF domain-containing protein